MSEFHHVKGLHGLHTLVENDLSFESATGHVEQRAKKEMTSSITTYRVCKQGRDLAGLHKKHSHHQKRSGTWKTSAPLFLAVLFPPFPKKTSFHQNFIKISSFLSSPIFATPSPHAVLAVGHFSNNASVQPHLVAIFIFGNNTSTDVEPLQCWVIVERHVVPRQQAFPFILKLHLVLKAVACVKYQKCQAFSNVIK